MREDKFDRMWRGRQRQRNIEIQRYKCVIRKAETCAPADNNGAAGALRVLQYVIADQRNVDESLETMALVIYPVVTYNNDV
jgi:hypothetical protein